MLLVNSDRCRRHRFCPFRRSSNKVFEERLYGSLRWHARPHEASMWCVVCRLIGVIVDEISTMPPGSTRKAQVE